MFNTEYVENKINKTIPLVPKLPPVQQVTIAEKPGNRFNIKMIVYTIFDIIGWIVCANLVQIERLAVRIVCFYCCSINIFIIILEII